MLIHFTSWMNLENKLAKWKVRFHFFEIQRRHKWPHTVRFHLCDMGRIDKSIETEHRLVVAVCVLVAQSCPALRNRMDCSPPGSSVYGTLQARILEWVAIRHSICWTASTDVRGADVSMALCVAVLLWHTRTSEISPWLSSFGCPRGPSTVGSG